MMRLALSTVAVCLAVLPAWAQPSAAQRALYDALGLTEIIAVMRQEGIDYGREMERQLFPGRGGAAWIDVVEQIYDPGVMEDAVVEGMTETLSDTDLAPLLEFFTSERGQRIVGFEVGARQALIDEDIESAAQEKLARMRAEADPRLELLEQFVEANDLVDSNVMGALNSNYAFYTGLIDGNAFPKTMTESDILADVWAQEPDIRDETDAWVYSYLAMAYQPLSDEDLEAYIAISETPEGRALNRALFNGFDEMYVSISRALGLAAARFMAGEDI